IASISPLPCAPVAPTAAMIFLSGIVSSPPENSSSCWSSPMGRGLPSLEQLPESCAHGLGTQADAIAMPRQNPLEPIGEQLLDRPYELIAVPDQLARRFELLGV